DLLLDGELITPDQCQTLLGNEPNGKTWQPGCMKIVQTNTPSKGRTTLNQDGDVTYIPDGNWDGSDQFNLLVVTSTTRFSDSVNPYIEIKTNIVQRPPNDFKNDKVKTSGGSVGFGMLSVLLGIIGLRRFRKK
ncbi:MAG: rhombotarget A, partial [Candidatus Acinetobacter avistercoris]|nr:rhombotarget A [Candidatus Acinetobacter avistercoris]